MKNVIKIFFLVTVSVFFSTVVFAQKAKPTPKVQLKPLPNFQTEVSAKAIEFYRKGQAFWKTLDIQKAIDAYTEAIKIEPNYVAALGERGTIYFLTRKHELALADLNSALKIESKNAKLLNYRGLTLTEIALRIKENEINKKPAADFAQKALTDFNNAIEIEPNNLTYFNGRGKLLLEFEFYKEAIADYQKSISIKPNPQAFAYLGLAKFNADEGDGLDEFEKAIELDSKYAEAFYIRGTINKSVSLFDDALNDFDEAISLNKYSAKYYNARGMVYFILGEGSDAVEDFTNAINEDKEFAMAYYNRAFAYKKFPNSVSENAIDIFRLQRQKMLEDLDSAIKYKPNFDSAYVERGLINSTDMRNKSTPDTETINRLKIALADFEQAIKINPKNAEAYNGRASCNDDLGKKDLALADYTKAIELDPKLATAYMGRMAIYCEMGKKELSIIDEKKIKALGFAAINVCNLGGK